MIRTADHDVVQFDGPVLELMTDSRTRFDRRIAQLGPDILGEEFDEQRFLKRLREDDQTRGIGDALLDQRNLCRRSATSGSRRPASSPRSTRGGR